MPYMRDFEVYPGALPPERRGAFALKSRPMVAAIRVEAAHRRMPAPFTKLNVSLEHPSMARDASVAFNIANVILPTGLDAIESLSEAALRPQIARLIGEALDLFRSAIDWDDMQLRTIVRDAGEHVGPYLVESAQLTTRQRSTGRVFRTIYEHSLAGTRIFVVRHERDGAESGRVLVMASDQHIVHDMFDPGTRRSFGHARSLRIIGDQLIYLNRETEPVTGVSLASFEQPTT